MPRSTRAFGLFLLCLIAPLAAAAPPAARPRESARYGIYMKTSRIGSMQTRSFDATHGQKPAVRLESDMKIRMTALGSNVEQTLTMTQLVDKAGAPLTLRVNMSSMGRVTTIDARYEPRQVVCAIDAGGQKSSKVVPIPAGVTLAGDPDLVGKESAVRMKVGQKTTLHFFEPMTMTIQKVESQVLRTEKRAVGGKPVTVFLVKSSSSFAGGSESWVDSQGRTLEDRSDVGLRMIREDLGASPSTLEYEPPQDFAIATAVKTAVKIPNPRKATTLRLRITGIPDESLILSDARQRVVERMPTGGAVTAVYQMQARELPATALPVVAGRAVKGTGDAPYLGITDPTVVAKAAELAAGEKDRAVLARRVRAWVKGHMQKPNNVGTPRSAAEIMRSRDGVCRDYATLFAAVARAAGVPTRVCSGIVYMNDSFFYHAWVECQLQEGDDGWYAFDPTLDDDFVDATHIKFAQGDPSEMFAAVRVVGQIKAEVLEPR
jgi:transglutaminase-like putative cysteine protease